MDTTSRIVENYVVFKLAKFDFPWPRNVGMHTDFTEPLLQKMYSLARKVFHEKTNIYVDILDETHINKNSALSSFLYVCDELFEDQAVDWSSVLALLDYAGELAIRCVDKELPCEVCAVIRWTTQFLNDTDEVHNWLRDQGGWESIMDYDHR